MNRLLPGMFFQPDLDHRRRSRENPGSGGRAGGKGRKEY